MAPDKNLPSPDPQNQLAQGVPASGEPRLVKGKGNATALDANAHWDESLSTALSSVLRDVEGVDSNLASRSSCWQDVVNAIEAAKTLDSAKAEKSSMRARLRKLGPEIRVLESLATMIPDQNGLSVLRGALVTMFKMVNLRLEIREKILDAFEDIPETFIWAVQAYSRFPNAPDLLEAVKRLYRTLIANVEILIGVLIRSHPQKNRMARLWKQLPGKEAEVVNRCLREVSLAASRVSQSSMAALERTTCEIHSKMSLVLEQGRNILAATSHVGTDMRGLRGVIDDGVTRVMDSQEIRNQKLLEENRTMFEEQRTALCEALTASILSGMRSIENGPHGRPHTPNSYDATGLSASWPLPATVPAVTLLAPPSPPYIIWQPRPILPVALPVLHHATRINFEGMLEMLDVPDQAAAETLADIFRSSGSLGAEAVGRGRYLMVMDRFSTWLHAPSWASDLVLVNGHCGDVTVNKLSPMSMFCACIAEALCTVQGEQPPGHSGLIVLHHFCGQHLLRRDPLSGPEGLIRSLVHQLLQHLKKAESPTAARRSPPPGSIDDELLRDLGEQDIPNLCRLFQKLLDWLDPNSLVFVVVDGISELETVLDGWRDDACVIVESLLDLVESADRGGPALRVLLASAERSTQIADEVVPDHRRVSLLAGNVHGGSPNPKAFLLDLEEELMSDDELPESPASLAPAVGRAYESDDPFCR